MPLRRRHRVIVAIRRARERSRLAHERPRDHAPHFVRTAQNLARRLADLVQLEQRNHFLVRRDLKHAVGRGVDDRRAGPHVLLAQLLDDLGARRRLVAERAAARCASRTRSITSRRKSVREQRKRLLQMNAGHLPMPGGGVLAGRRQRAASESARGLGGRQRAPSSGRIFASPSRHKFGKLQARAAARYCRACRCPRSP